MQGSPKGWVLAEQGHRMLLGVLDLKQIEQIPEKMFLVRMTNPCMQVLGFAKLREGGLEAFVVQ